MLVRKRKEKSSKKKRNYDGADSEENLQSVRSWIRKIEQSTSSVSSRLSAVEKRLSGRMSEAADGKLIGIKGPVETLFIHLKKKDTPEVVRVLDTELCYLHNELLHHQQQTEALKEQFDAFEKTQATITTEMQTLQTTITELATTLEDQQKKPQRSDPFIMHLGSLEVPVEFTGIIGGLLVFLIAGLVLIGEKEILLTPWFLIPVGLLLIGFALIKMIKNRSTEPYPPLLSLPMDSPPTQLELPIIEEKEGY
jgi:hypothetical protein